MALPLDFLCTNILYSCVHTLHFGEYCDILSNLFNKQTSLFEMRGEHCVL